MTITETIGLGIFSGVLTAVFLSAIKQVWVKSFQPTYRKFKYQGADVAGTWIAEYKDEGENEVKANLSLNLVQSAHDLSGSLLFSYESPEKAYQIDYTVKGEYWEGYLNISCRSKDRKKFSQGNILLKLTENGISMEGQFNFRNALEDRVTTNALRLERN